jgi:hypothetical protein
MSSLELPVCQRHPAAVAGWACQSCSAALCPDCVATQTLSLRTELDSCVLCGGTTRQLKVHRSRVTLAQRLPQALLFPFGKSALMSLVAVSAVIGVLGWFFWNAIIFVKLFCFVLWMGTFWSTIFHIIRLTARGEDELSAPDFSELYNDVVVPAVRGVAATGVVWIPAWYIYRHSGWVFGTSAMPLLTDPVIWLLVVAGAAYAPMALVIAASGGGVLRILNPVYVFGYIARVGRDYAVVALAIAGLFGVRVLLGIAGHYVAKAPVPVVAPWVAELLSLYAPFAMARVLGLLLHVRGDVLGYGMNEDYLEPVLRDDARGTLNFSGTERKNQPPPAPGASNYVPATGIGATLEALRRAVDTNDVDRAVELYAAAPLFTPQQLAPAYHFAVGQGAATRGNYPLAVRALTAASETDPSDPIAPRAFVVLARVYGERMNDSRKADAIYQFVIERYPGTSAAQFALTRMSPVKA